MRKPLIGISCNYEQDLKRFSVSEGYVRMIEAAGGRPLLLPVYSDMEDLHEMLSLVDGVLLGGGTDIDPQAYGETDRGKCGPIVPVRDRQEIEIVRYLTGHTDKPLFCICRGAQILNVAAGGTLCQDLESEGPYWNHARSNYPGHVPCHTVQVKKGSLLEKITGTPRLGVNSLHHQGMRKAGKNLKVAACSQDGVIEAVEMDGKAFVLGVQWHPEKMTDSPEQRLLFEAFIEAAKSGR